MSYHSTSRVECPRLQKRLVEVFQLGEDPSLMRSPSPFSDFIWSDLNRAGLQVSLNPYSENKLRLLDVVYDQRLLESSVVASDLTQKICNATTKRGNGKAQFSIDPTDGLMVEETFNTDEWIYACENNDDVIVHEVMKLINALYEKNASRITQRASALLGNWDKTVYNSTNTITEGSVKYLKLQTKRPTTFLDINPEAFEEVNHAVDQTLFQMAAIFSGRQFQKYARTMEAGCCSNQGIALDEMLMQYGFAVNYDRRVQRYAGGPEYSWVVMPKALQPVWYTANNDRTASALKRLTGQPSFSGANYWKGVIQDPQSGMPMDIIISDDCGVLSVILRNVVDVKALPLDMFAPGDDMEGVRWFTGMKIENSGAATL